MGQPAMKNKPRCSTCGRGHLSAKRVEITFRVKGVPVVVRDVPVEACDTCGELIVMAEDRRRARAIAEQKAQALIAAG